MHRRRISKKAKERFTRRIRDFNRGISRPVKVYLPANRVMCPNCYFDKFTGKSTGTCKWTLVEAIQKQTAHEASGGVATLYKFFTKGRCPVCKSEGYLETRRTVKIPCNITWDPARSNSTNQFVGTPPGFEGSTIVSLKLHPKHFETFRRSLKVKVDNISCKLAKPPILRGLGTKSLMVVTLFTSDKWTPTADDVVNKVYGLGSIEDELLTLSDDLILALSDGYLLDTI